MFFQFSLAVINLKNSSPFSLIQFHLQNSSVEKTPKTMENHCKQPGTLHITAREPKTVLRKMIKYGCVAFRKSNSLLSDEN